MKENSEVLSQQARSAKVQVGSGPTIELVTKAGSMETSGIICPPNCIPYCLPSCEPNIFKPPCDPVWRLPRPKPSGSSNRG